MTWLSNNLSIFIGHMHLCQLSYTVTVDSVHCVFSSAFTLTFSLPACTQLYHFHPKRSSRRMRMSSLTLLIPSMVFASWNVREWFQMKLQGTSRRKALRKQKRSCLSTCRIMPLWTLLGNTAVLSLQQMAIQVCKNLEGKWWGPFHKKVGAGVSVDVYICRIYVHIHAYVCVCVCMCACKCVHHFLQPLPKPHCPTGREHVATRESFEEGNSPEGKVKASSAVRAATM